MQVNAQPLLSFHCSVLCLTVSNGGYCVAGLERTDPHTHDSILIHRIPDAKARDVYESVRQSVGMLRGISRKVNLELQQATLKERIRFVRQALREHSS